MIVSLGEKKFKFNQAILNMMQEQYILLWLGYRISIPVDEDAANIIMADWGFFGTGSHPEWPQEAVHQDGQLEHIFSLSLQHVEDNLVSLPHTFGMGRADVVLNNDLPLSPTKPATHEALYLQYRPKL